jgi:hypothetical protein
MKKVENDVKKLELHQIPELGDISSIMKSGANDSTHVDF